MFVSTLLFTGLLGLVGASPLRICQINRGIEDVKDLISKNEKCLCNETFGIDGDYNQTECKCFEVPKKEDNCNLKCFEKGFKKLNLETSFKKQFRDRLKCTDSSFRCFRPCDDMENVTATKFWDRYSSIMQCVRTNNTSECEPEN